MKTYEPIKVLPVEIQQKWMATLQSTTEYGYKLVAIRPTAGNSFEGQRITVLVLDENGFPMSNIPVAFSYSTAPQYIIAQDFMWMPPAPHRAFIVPTQGSGQIDQVQGSVVKEGEPGGVTVYILDAEIGSDVVAGCGMLADHTGLHLTFQLKTGKKTIEERLSAIESMLGL